MIEIRKVVTKTTNDIHTSGQQEFDKKSTL